MEYSPFVGHQSFMNISFSAIERIPYICVGFPSENKDFVYKFHSRISHNEDVLVFLSLFYFENET